jgi:hypothetical protein
MHSYGQRFICEIEFLATKEIAGKDSVGQLCTQAALLNAEAMDWQMSSSLETAEQKTVGISCFGAAGYTAGMTCVLITAGKKLHE